MIVLVDQGSRILQIDVEPAVGVLLLERPEHDVEALVDHGIGQLENGKYQARWGLFDDSLFDLATQKLITLEAGEAPWFLSVLTLDTHHPRGHPSKSCQRMPSSDEPMSNAIYCSDQLISQFIENAMEIVDMEETVIVLFSDHLSLRNSLAEKLNQNASKRRLTLMVFDDRPPAEHTMSGSHFDVAPTVLDAARIPLAEPIGHGQSLYSPAVAGRSGKPQYANLWNAPRALGASEPATMVGVTVSPADMSLTIGNLKLAASRTGFEFEYGMFLAVLNEEGKVLDAVYSDDYEKLLGRYQGKFVIGISLLEGDPGPTVFAGRLSRDPSSIRVQPLVEEIHIGGETIGGWISPP